MNNEPGGRGRRSRHEDPWHKLARIRTIRTDGTRLTKIHTRTMAMGIFGHEFWSADGKTIWYDLQTPRGEDFWLAGYNIDTGERTWYHLQRNEWSIHFNVTRDGKLSAATAATRAGRARPTDREPRRSGQAVRQSWRAASPNGL